MEVGWHQIYNPQAQDFGPQLIKDFNKLKTCMKYLKKIAAHKKLRKLKLLLKFHAISFMQKFYTSRILHLAVSA